MTPDKLAKKLAIALAKYQIDIPQDVLKSVSADVVDQSMPCGETKYPLDAYIWLRGDEWVLEIDGEINDVGFTCRHPISSDVRPENVAGLDHLYVGKGAVVEELCFSDIPENDRSKHPGIDTDHTYIALIDGRLHHGKFSQVWFGWNFYTIDGPNRYNGNLQFDPPGTNGCNWQKVWKVIDRCGLNGGDGILLSAGLDPVDIIASDELRYAAERRAYAIKNRCTFRGQTITEESPLCAWFYKPTMDKMPKRDNGEDDDDF